MYAGNYPINKVAGSAFQVSMRFENMSDPCAGCDVTPPTSVTAYFRPLTGGTYRGEEKFAIPQLNRAGVIWLTWNHNLDAPAGEYSFVVVLDPDNTVAEKDESNNNWPFPFTISASSTTSATASSTARDLRSLNLAAISQTLDVIRAEIKKLLR